MTFEKQVRGAARKYLENQGFEVLADDFEDYMVAKDGDELVLVSIQARVDSSSGFPAEILNRERFERTAMLWLADSEDSGFMVRCDAVAMIVLGVDEAFLGHHKDCLND